MNGSAAAKATGGWGHFAVAAGALLAGAIGWQAAGVTLAKKAVRPPEGTKLEDHRLLGFPQRLGTFVLAPEREGPGTKEDPKDGVEVVDEDTLALLGTLKNRWNWYYMATYRDTEPGPTKRYVRLDLTYYTGLLEAAPHDPERCIAAQGGTILREKRKPIEVPLPGQGEASESDWLRTSHQR